MLLSSILLVPTVAHAATGTVSVNNGTEVVVPQTQTTVSIPIQIMGSDPLNGFDVQVFADPHVLSGASISLTGSMFTSPRVVLECINGVLVFGPTCAPQDASGVVHFEVVQLGALIPNSGSPDTLFTINYNILGASALTAINFNSGCSGTSISGLCVTISNGSGTALSEMALSGSFANLNDFSMTPAFASISSPAKTPISDAINYVALGAFSDSLTETLSGAGASVCTLASGNPGSVNLAFPTGSDTLTCNSSTNGDFPVTVTASGFSSGIMHTATVDYNAEPAGFSSVVSPTSVTVARGFSESSTVVTFKGVSGFSGPVAITATAPSGITATLSTASITFSPDGSGFSSGTAGLTISVGASTASGAYTVSITGGASLQVIVPSSDFVVAVLPSALAVPRGSTAAATISLLSTGAFSGTVTLTAAVTPVALDTPANGVNNIVPAFFSSTVTLTVGGTGSTAFFGTTVKIGVTPNPANTATGQYKINVTGTSGTISHSAIITLSVQDFSLGPNFCPGNTAVNDSPSGEWNVAYIGELCNSFTLSNQPVANGGAQSEFWMQVNSLGGLGTNSAAFVGIQSGNPAAPGRGVFVPELGFRTCYFRLFQNGVELSSSYIKANGPVVRGDPTDGCRGDGQAFPNDASAGFNNPDFYVVTADALSHTALGTYTVDVCGEYGTLVNCGNVTLTVINPPTVSQFLWTHGPVSQKNGGHFSIVLTNTDASFTTFDQLTISAVGSNGDTLTAQSAIVKIAPNSISPTINLFVALTPAMIGETFTFTTSIQSSVSDKGAVLVSSFSAGDNVFNGFFPPFTASGTSTLQAVSSTFTVVP